MKKARQRSLLSFIESFFGSHLQRACGASPHTVRAYGNSLRLFFCFAADRKGCSVADLQVADLRVEVVCAFLTNLESERANSVATRNYRLAAIRSFVRHLLRHDLTHAEQCARILAVPSKRARLSPASYLEPEDVRLILKQPDRKVAQGRRDHALLLFLYNTGARISEALGVQLQDLSLVDPRQVRLHGKGGKDRLCPLWRDTVIALQGLPTVKMGDSGVLLFRNARGEPLTRDGAAYLLRKYVASASISAPALRRRRVTPHVLRHSCAVALLQAGVDITVIRDYLGHTSIATTSRYITTNLQMKREALDAFWKQAGISPVRATPWKPKPDLLAYLASL